MRPGTLRGLCAAAVAFGSAWTAAGGFQTLRVADGAAGVNPMPRARSTWQTGFMRTDAKPDAGEGQPFGDDFFTRELGAPWRERFTTGTNGFARLFGCRGKDPTQEPPAIRLCRGWGRLQGQAFGFHGEIVQNVATTEWTFVKWENGYRHPKSFVIVAEPGKRTPFKVRLGSIRNLVNITGVEFCCLTPQAEVSVTDGRLTPLVVPMLWRGTYEIPFKPWKAGISVGARPNYVLKVNGREISRGLGLDGRETVREDITSVVREGSNTVEFATYYMSGYAPAGEVLIEGFAVSETGETVVFPGYGNWQARLAGRPWEPVRCSANPKSFAGVERFADVESALGSRPLHAGPLRVSLPPGRPYAVWDVGEAVDWRIELPPALGEAKVEACVTDALKPDAPMRHAGASSFEGLGPGAYHATWTLTRGTDVLDRESREFVVAGPIDQTLVACDEVERLTDARKRLVQEQDCADEIPVGERYAWDIARAGRLDSPKNRPRVGEKNGLRFRETGEADGDWFGYKLDVTRLGVPYLLEVDYPDDREVVLYARVVAGYPCGFRNNPTGQQNGIPLASGAVRTGWMQPLSGQKRTMRLVFFSGSKNVTVSFDSGGGRAAVCGWRLYDLPEGLPGMKVPEGTTRLYGNHCERPLWGQWAGVNPYATPGWPDDYDGAYAASYQAIANRIAYMRYAGQNLAIDGVYMYKQGFPTLSGESEQSSPSFDFMYLAAKMYRHNAIRALAGFEYMLSPKIMLDGGFDIGDREMRESKTPRTPIYCVTRYGKQMSGFGGMGLNYLAPPVYGSMTNLLADIYARYEPTGAFEGLFMICNGWWQPGFPVSREIGFRDTSYDDLTVGLFERETGIRLDVPYTPERFARRYDKLTGPYEKEWFAWRARRMRATLDEIASVIRARPNKWRLYAVPLLGTKKPDPFASRFATPRERDMTLASLLKDCGFDPRLYGRDRGEAVTLVPTLAYARKLDRPSWGQQVNAGTRRVVRRNDAAYFYPIGLNERWTNTEHLETWWWRASCSTVFDVKASGDAAFHDLVDLCSGTAPRLLVHTWLDVNVPTAHADAERRFAEGFYRTPEGEGIPCEEVTGVQARVFGGRLQLVNDTPYAVEGVAARSGERIRLRPYSVAVRDRPEPLSFAFADSAVATQALERTRLLVDSPELLGQVRPEKAQALRAAWAKKDAYAMVALLRDFEVADVADGIFRADDLGMVRARKGDLRLIGERAEAFRPELGKSVTIPATDPAYRTESRARTLSMLVRTDGTGGEICMGGDPFRFDVAVEAGGLQPRLLFFCNDPDDGRSRHFSVSTPTGQPLAGHAWHRLVFTVDPATVGQLWADGRLVGTLPFRGLDPQALGPKGGSLGSSRATCGGRHAVPGLTFAGLEFRDVRYYEGVMDVRDIVAESQK